MDRPPKTVKCLPWAMTVIIMEPMAKNPISGTFSQIKRWRGALCSMYSGRSGSFLFPNLNLPMGQ